MCMWFGAKSEVHGEISLKTFVRVDKTANRRIMQQIRQIQQTDKRHSYFIYTTISFMLSHCDLIFIFWQKKLC